MSEEFKYQPRPSTYLKNRLKNTAAFLIGLFAALLILELFLVFYNPIIFRQQGNKIVLPANITYHYKNEKIKGVDSVIVHTKNKLGFRGKEKPADFNTWTSIITVGGSTTECRFITDGKDWPALLEKKLEKDFKKTWVNNAGLDGHSTFGHQILLEDFLIKIKPNYILFLIGSNDVGRKDLGTFDNNHLKESNNWVDYLKNNSAIVGLIGNIKRSLDARYKGVAHSSNGWQDRVIQDTSLFYKKFRTELKSHEKLKPVFKKRLQYLIKKSKDNNITPVFITQPSIAGKKIEELKKIKTTIKIEDLATYGDARWWALEKYNDITRQTAEEENILLIDLAQRMPKSEKLFYDFHHYTNEGAEVVAEVIYQVFRESL